MTLNNANSIRGLANTALIFGIVSVIIELAELIFAIGIPLGYSVELYVTMSVVGTIVLFVGLGLSIASDILVSVAKSRNPNPNESDKKKLRASSILSIIFTVLLLASVVILLIFRGTIF